jgi:hypothetical protein
MANAPLKISAELDEAVSGAQESSSKIRSLVFRIVDETLTLTGSSDVCNTSSEDFKSVVDSLSPNEAVYFLFAVNEALPTVFTEVTNNSNRIFVLFVLVPDGANVRERMMYSSSRQGLKQHFTGSISSEYVANDVSELTWDQYIAYVEDKKGDQSSLMSSIEKDLKVEKSMVSDAATNVKAEAMQKLPFMASAEVQDALEQYDKKERRLVEVVLLDGEIFELKATELHIGQAVEEVLDASEPSFIIYNYEESGKQTTVLVFLCGDNVPLRQKVTLASSKSTFYSIVQAKGIKIDKSIEVSEASHIQVLLQPQVLPTQNLAEAGMKVNKPKVTARRRPSAMTRKKFVANTDT